MDCTHTQNLMHAYLDGELDLVRHLEIEHHLQDCAACAELHESHRMLRAALGADALYFRAPAGLRERLRATPVPAGVPGPAGRRPPWRLLGAAAAAACVALLAWGLGRFGPRPPDPAPPAADGLAQEVLAGHVRSLMANHLADVSSSNRHEVKPWFTGKLDFSPAVHDLSDQAFPLVGGRLDYLGGRPVAALVYQRRQHVINLFVWPAAPDAARGPWTVEHQGYRAVHWAEAGMDHWAVSDLNERELLEFVQLVRDREPRLIPAPRG